MKFGKVKVKAISEEELDDKLENLFNEFQEEPLATASTGQIHYRRPFSSVEVAVKVQRPDIEERRTYDN